MPTPLHAGHGGPETPEALLISALIEEGEFNPERYGVTIEDLNCWEQLFSYCLDHQQSAGIAPSFDVVARKYPEFELTPNVNPEYAAKELKVEAHSRLLRDRMRAATELLNDGDGHGAQELLSTVPGVLANSRKKPLSGFDASTLEDEFDVARIPVPWPSLEKSNGGIGEGELWYLGARLGQGKSNTACAMAAAAAKGGYTVLYHSLEMPSGQILHKIRRNLCRGDTKLMGLLEGSKEDWKKALDLIREKTPGDFFAMDPAHGRCSPAEIEQDCREYDLVIVDHMGLLTDAKGRKAIEDWRVQAEISNSMKQATLRTRGRVLGLAQINREGDSSSPDYIPKASQLAGSDDLGRDADVIVNMQRFSKSAMKASTEKNRNNPQVKWYFRFLPGRANYTECTREDAQELAANDGEWRD